MALHCGWNHISANFVQTRYLNTVVIPKQVNQQGYESNERIQIDNPSVHNQPFSRFNFLYLQVIKIHALNMYATKHFEVYNILKSF